MNKTIFKFVDNKYYTAATSMDGMLIPASKRKEVEAVIDKYVYEGASEYKIWPLIQKGLICLS